jgi:hypothetical protein
MSEQLWDTFQALETRNLELSETLETLKQTQIQLVQTAGLFHSFEYQVG